MNKMKLRQKPLELILLGKAENKASTPLLRFDNMNRLRSPKLLICCLMLTLLLLAATSAGAATYYLDATTGLDSNPGTGDSPFKSIQRALPNYTGDGVKVTQGDTVIIAPGSYGALVYDLNGDAGRTDWITYQGSDPANKPYFSGFNIDDAANAYLKFVNIHILVDYPASGESKTETGFVTGSSYVFFGNCDLFGPPSTGDQYYGVYVGSSHYITFEDCEMKWGAYIVLVDGSSVGECSNITFRRCYIHDTRDDGMYLRGITNLTIEDCIIHNVNTQYAINHQDNIALDDISTLIFRRNIIYVDSDKTSLAQGLYSCLDFGGSNENFLIENNLFYGKYYGRPLCLWYVDGLVLANNTWDTISVSSISSSCTLLGCTNVKIYNNVFGTLNYDTYNGTVKYSSAFDAYPDKDYNIHERYSGSNIGPHSLDLTAVSFVNDVIGDYHLTDNAVAINFGIDNSYTPDNDLDGVSRDTSPDAGCYEFGGTAPLDTTPPTIVSVNASKNSVEILFDEQLNTGSAQNTTNYNIDNGITITAASLDTELSTVTLTTTDHTEDTTYSLTVNAVEDLATNAMPQTMVNYVFNSGLVAHWKLDDGTGTTAHDSSQTGNTGTLINEPNWTTGKFHGALSFQAPDQALEVATTAWNRTKGTIALWAYPTAFPSITQFIFGHVAEGWSNRIQIYTNNAEGALGLGLGDTHTKATNIYDLETQTWYHIVLTWDEPYYAVYVDGIEQTNGTYTGLSTLSTYADIANTGNRTDRQEGFSGTIDQVRIYNRPLTAGEVLNLFNELANLFSPIGDKQVDEGSNLSFAIETLDPNIEVLVQDHNLPSEPGLIDNTFNWTPTYDDAGGYETTFVAEYGEIEDFETITITVNNVNRAPVIEPVADQQVDENSFLTFAVNVLDPDEDDVSCTADNLPAGATFADYIFEWTPTYDQAGNYTLSFTATDGELEDVENVLITVNNININQAPVLEQIPDKLIDEGQTLTFPVVASDPDGDPLLCYIFNMPAGAVFVDNTFTWTPDYEQAGIYWVFVVAFDGQIAAWDVVTITVNDVVTPPPIDNGLVGYWKLDDASGTVAQDSSDTSNTGLLIDGPIWTTGKFGTAINFETADQAVEIATTDWNRTGGTIALWAYPTAFPSVAQFLFGHVAEGWANRIQIYTNNTEGGLGIGLGDTHRKANNIYDMDIGIWYHIVLTWNGTDYAVYVNGVQQASGTYTGLSTLSTYADIANTGYRTDRHEAFSGIIDEVRIYDRPLNADEVTDIFSYVAQ